MMIGQLRTLRTLRLAFELGAHAPVILTAAASFPRWASAQAAHRHASAAGHDSTQMTGMADHAMSGAMDMNMLKHMELTPPRTPTHEDSVRATALAAEVKRAIAKYADTTAAVADGYKMFLPNVKTQRVYHFTNGRHAVGAMFHFDPAKPTSILYTRGGDGRLHLVGAMYTMPKRAPLSRLDARIPIGIARWHKHVNWCVPKKGEEARWLERRDGAPVFGPESPVATKAECDAVRGNFFADPLGWMVHVNVFAGTSLESVFRDEHANMSKR